MKTLKYLLASFIMMLSLGVNAQGIKIYLKDGTLLDYTITDISQVDIITLADGTKGFCVLDAEGHTVEYPLSVLSGLRCEDLSGFYYGHKAVDLGLPSGTLWAEYNVGATKPEQAGSFFFWAGTKPVETSPWPYYNYDWQNYSKYRTEGTFMDMLTELLPEDDAAHQKWGDGWCIPTMVQKRELLMYTEREQATVNGVVGWYFTSRINDKKIFFPATGIYYKGSILRVGEQTNIWTSTLHPTDNRSAYVMCDRISNSMLDGAGFDMDAMSLSFNLSQNRNFGMPIRPVVGHAAEKQLPVVSASPNDVLKVSGVSAQLLSFVHIPSTATTTVGGVCYSKTETTPTLDNANVAYGIIADGRCVTDLKVLEPMSIYYVTYFVTIDGKTTYTFSSTIETTNPADMVITGEAVSGTSTSAKIRAGFDLTSALYDNVERYVCYGLEANPTIDGSKAEATGDKVSCVVTLNDLTEGATYHYRACLKIDGQIFYGEDKTFVAEEFGEPLYVDLGLSVKWATMNVGATAPEEIGDYFAWAETTPRTAFGYSDYLYQKGTYANDYMKNYNGTDRLQVLTDEHDAATVNMGPEWRMPTTDEAKELYEQCTLEKATKNGVECVKVTGPNGNCIYVPYAGYIYGDKNYSGPTYACPYFWSSQLRWQMYGNSNHDFSLAVGINLQPSNPGTILEYRGYGLNVRAVRK